MREIKLCFETFGKWKWIPLYGILFAPFWLWLQLFIIRSEYPVMPLLSYVSNVMPVFAGVWPVLFLREAVSSQGGELHFHWHPKPIWWIARTIGLILLFAITGFAVAFVFFAPFSPAGIGFVARYFLFCWLYGWLGFFAMYVTKEITWTLFASILFLLVHGFGRLFQTLPWNPYRDGLYEFYDQVSIHHAFTSILWGVFMILIFVISLKRGRVKQ